MMAEPADRYDGAYVGSFSGGLMVGVACHTGLGMLLGHGEELVKATKVAVESIEPPQVRVRITEQKPAS